MNAERGSDQPEKERASPPESAPVAELTVSAIQEELTVGWWKRRRGGTSSKGRER